MSAAGHFGTALPRLREIKVGRVLIPKPGRSSFVNGPRVGSAASMAFTARRLRRSS